MNSVFRYYRELPQLRFQWSEKSGASHYIIEIDESPEFNNLQISKQVAAASFIQSELGSGTWYWRVQPVFSSAYTGRSVYSSVASFRIEQSSDPNAPVLELPEPKPAGKNYIVQSGDTLIRIARQEYGDASMWKKIVDYNNILNPNLIFLNQVLFIPD
jgi:LysM repeat protein